MSQSKIEHAFQADLVNVGGIAILLFHSEKPSKRLMRWPVAALEPNSDSEDQGSLCDDPEHRDDPLEECPANDERSLRGDLWFPSSADES